MAYSKAFFLLGLLFDVSSLMSSQVSARELAEKTQSVEESKGCGRACGVVHVPGGSYGLGYGHGVHYPPATEEKTEANTDGYYGLGAHHEPPYSGHCPPAREKKTEANSAGYNHEGPSCGGLGNSLPEEEEGGN